MSHDDDPDCDRISGPWDRLAEYLFDEIKQAQIMKNHAALGFGAAQLIVLLLGLYAGSQAIFSYTKIVENNRRFYGPQFPEIATGAMIAVAVIGAIWFMMILQRLLKAFHRAIADELRWKAVALRKRIKFLAGGGENVPRRILDLLTEMGLDDETQGNFA